MSEIKIKRIYEAANKTDGFRILVDRLWPRGLSKADARLDIWLKNIAPSTELRKWFTHKPERFQEFKVRYQKELSGNVELNKLVELVNTNKVVTLLYAAHNENINQAVVLSDFLKKLK